MGRYIQGKRNGDESPKTELVMVKGTVHKITLDGTEIQNKRSIKFLGMTMNPKLTEDEPVIAVAGRVTGMIHRLKFPRQFLTEKQLRVLYMAWVQGIIMANAPAYLPGLSKKHVEKIQIATNKVIRFICNVRIKDRISMKSLRSKLKISSIQTLKNRVEAQET